MADHIKQTRNAINAKKQEIQNKEHERAEWADQLPQLEALVEQQGESAESATMRTEIKSSVATIDATLARLRSELAALEAELPQAAEPAGPKFDPEKHPLLRKTMEKQEPEKAVSFSTGDIVEVQWTDKSWYKAKIQSILGSVSAPKYLVKFIEYDESLTVDRTAVRPLANKRKRDVEPAFAPAPPTPVTSTPHVISGPASMNPNAQAAKNNTVSDSTEKKPSRIANKQTLKKRQGTWQDFQAQAGKKGIVKKDSMFRTSTTAGSRVGFTGSGKGMTETYKRKRYDRKEDADKDDDRY